MKKFEYKAFRHDTCANAEHTANEAMDALTIKLNELGSQGFRIIYAAIPAPYDGLNSVPDLRCIMMKEIKGTDISRPVSAELERQLDSTL